MAVSLIWLLVVYVPVTHWVWGGGWLAELRVMDYAGGIVVHVTAGVSALVIAVMLGAREGFPAGVRPPHAPWMVMVGASLLWVGWRSEEHTSELQSLMRNSYAVFCWIKNNNPPVIGRTHV